MCIAIWYASESLSSSTGTKAPPRWRIVTSGWAQACGPQTSWNQKGDDWDSWNTTLLPYHQPIRGSSHTLQTSPQILPIKTLAPKTSGSSGFWAQATHSHSPCLVLAINLSLLQTSMFQFVVWPHCASGTWIWVRQQKYTVFPWPFLFHPYFFLFPFFLWKSEYNFPLHIDFLKNFSCVEFSCLFPTPGPFLRAGVI